jgi:signal transduction histidine kinase/CheY-like chemotaxis protein
MSVNTIDGVSTAGGLGTSAHQPEDGRPIILVVDDRAINRDFLVSLLNYSGYRTIEANSPTELPAVDHLDLIITDVHMPGMDGLTFLRAMRGDSITRRVPVILYTAAYKTPELEARAKGLGAFAVLTKPTAPEVILEYVRAALLANAWRNPALSSEVVLAPAAPVSAASPPFLSDRAAALVEFMLDLAAERNPEQLLKMFCHSARGLVKARGSSVHMVAPGDAPSHLLFSTSTSSGSPGSVALPTCDCELIGLVKQARGRCLGKVEAAELGIVSQEAAGSVLYVPIATAANHLGCLCLMDKLGEQDFSEEDKRLITTLATKLALVYENNRFYEEIQQFSGRLAVEIEDRKRAEHELELSRNEQTRLKDEFLSHVSHELRSPVMVLQQFLEILMEGVAGEINTQQREYITTALRNAHQLNTMIGDLLDATRIETGKLRVDLRSMPLPEVLDEAVASARPGAEQKHIALSLDIPASLPLVIADRSRVRQIATNLLDNALKFTPEYGSITVRAGLDQKNSKLVRIEVSDTGCGMSPDDSARVFERLYQVPRADCSARKGLGLGLCICKQLITLQGGQVQVESQRGVGSTFSFTLPVFSVASLVEPMLGEDLVPESIFWLMVELCSSGKAANQELTASVRETIERCVLPDLDVVMPDTFETRTGQMFVVLARAEERGVQVLARRLEDQLKLNPYAAGLPGPPLVGLSKIDLSVARGKSVVAERRPAAVEEIEKSLKIIVADRS